MSEEPLRPPYPPSEVNEHLHSNNCSSEVKEHLHSNNRSSEVNEDLHSNNCASEVKEHLHSNNRSSEVKEPIHSNNLISEVKEHLRSNNRASEVPLKLYGCSLKLKEPPCLSFGSSEIKEPLGFFLGTSEIKEPLGSFLGTSEIKEPLSSSHGSSKVMEPLRSFPGSSEVMRQRAIVQPLPSRPQANHLVSTQGASTTGNDEFAPESGVEDYARFNRDSSGGESRKPSSKEYYSTEMNVDQQAPDPRANWQESFVFPRSTALGPPPSPFSTPVKSSLVRSTDPLLLRTDSAKKKRKVTFQVSGAEERVVVEDSPVKQQVIIFDGNKIV